MKVVTVEQMVAAEREADESGTISYDEMMQNAGRAVAEVVAELLPPQGRVAILVGPGNNGGDGLVAAAVLVQETDAEVGVYLLRPRDDALTTAAQEAGVFVADAENDQRWRILRTMVGSANILVDALLGTGIELPLRDSVSTLLKQAAGAAFPKPDAPLLVYPTSPVVDLPLRARVVAVDCPTGLDCDTGDIDDAALPADITVTFAAAKRGHVLMPGGTAIGELIVAEIGIPPLRDVPVTLADSAAVRGMLPPRTPNSHKGTYGTVLVVAGSLTYPGATVLSGAAAYRAGAGLVRMAVPEALTAHLAGTLREAVWLPLPDDPTAALEALREQGGPADVLLLGPGLGTAAPTAEFVSGLLVEVQRGGELPQRLVIDADGLNLLAQIDAWPDRLPPGTILTPHPGEMGRLTGLSSADVQANRFEVAAEKAAEWGVVLVLKGAYTLVASPEGETTVIPYAEDALATAGTGDVLAGCIAGLLAQGASAQDAAVAGSYSHGLAGQLTNQAVGARAATAGDVLSALAPAFRALGG